MRKRDKGNAGKITNIPLPFEAWAYRVINPELESLSEIEVLENEEMWSSRIIDEVSSKESIPGVISQLPLQDNPTQR